MTPDKRLDQLEPVVADVLQKVDQLIQGQGQIINEVYKISTIDKNTTTTAEAVAKLTLTTQRQYEEVKAEQADFRQEVRRGFQQVSQKFDQIVELLR